MYLESECQFSVGQASRAGIKDVNEDSIGIRIPTGAPLVTKGVVAVIADGVSAAEAGKEASETCVQNFLSDYFSTPDAWSVKKSAHQVLVALNRWLYGQGQKFIDAHKGYVSTLSIVIIKSRTAHIFHVGDTRVYRLRKGDMEQITNDHATAISEKQTYLTRAMGLDTRLEVDYQTLDVDVGDIFVLTTDGIHDYVADRNIKLLVEQYPEDFEQACADLIQLALNNDSPDNVSCQILRVDSQPLQNVDDVYYKLTELPFPPYLEKAQVLDGLRIEREIHASNRSQLYLVSDIETDERYVMKTPSVNFEDDPAYIERFIMESWIGSRIQNAHVVAVVERQERRKSCLYYLTEYVDGITLEQWMREHPRVSVQETIYLIEQVIKGVRALHRRETLHQDIKPGNIVVDKNGVVKIIDFGSCLVAGIAEISVPMERETMLGTASYTAPDYSLGVRPTVRSEVFSLGVIVFEMLAGVLPFQGKLDDCKSQRDFASLRYKPVHEYNPLVPGWMDGVLRKALEINPEKRFSDVSEFLFSMTHPSSEFELPLGLPLAERNPVLFWKSTALLFALSAIVLLLLLLKALKP